MPLNATGFIAAVRIPGIMKEDEIIVLKHFDNAIDAHIARTKLDAYGVPCFLTEENMAGLLPGQSINAFKVRLHLFAADRERAIQILGGGDLSIQYDGEDN